MKFEYKSSGGGGPPGSLLPQGRRRLETDALRCSNTDKSYQTSVHLWQGGFEMMDKLMTHLERHFTLSHYDERRVTHTHARSDAPLRRASRATLYQRLAKG